MKAFLETSLTYLEGLGSSVRSGLSTAGTTLSNLILDMRMAYEH